jgi:hypothetical protein
MKLWKRFALLPLITYSLVSASAQQPPTKDEVHWCASIPAPPVLQEARFTAVYTFETAKDGKPILIRKVLNPFPKLDEPLIDCISKWSLPSASGTVTAAFAWEWGWTDLEVSAKGFKKSVPYQLPKHDPQHD